MAACAPSNAPRSEQQDLAPAALLGRGPEHGHPEPGVVGDPGQGQAGPGGHGRDHVVPAGVADGRQGVVLGAHHHVQRPRPGPGRERRRQVADPPLDLEPGPLQQLAQPGAGLLLLEPELGVGVDAVAERHQLVPGLGDPLPGRLLGVSHVRSSCSRSGSRSRPAPAPGRR